MIEVLVFLLQNTDCDPFGALVEFTKPVLLSAVYDRRLNYFEKEDLMQEGRMVLMRAIKDYDFNSSLTFLEYYKLALRNHFSNFLKKQHTHKRKANNSALSLDEQVEYYGVHIQGHAAIETQPENILLLKERFEKFRKNLSKFESHVFQRDLEGATTMEIAGSSGCTKKQVVNARYRYKRKMVKFLG